MELTSSQKLAMESIDKPTAIIAGAGSGKTEVLVGRLVNILKKNETSLNQILCVTFTEKSAQELKHRIATKVSDAIKLELPFCSIGTFHGFFLDLIREQSPLLGIPEWTSVWNEHTAKLSIHRHCRRTLLNGLADQDPHPLLLVEALEFRDALLLLEDLMHFRWHAERCLRTMDHGPGTMDQKIYMATRILYEKILVDYTAEKRERQALDFQDLEITVFNLLSNHADILKIYQNRFRHILVDEAQDINDLQREIINLLFDPKKNCLCIVGDPKQSIYRFRGANVEGFYKTVERIIKAGGRISASGAPGAASSASGQMINLKENFRSRPNVLEFINHTFNRLFSPVEYSELLPTREPNPQGGAEVITIESEPKTSAENLRKQEAKNIAQYILEYINRSDTNYGDVAILFQSLTDIRHYEGALREANIPYRLFGGRGFLNAQEVIDLLFCLKLVADIEDRLAIVGLMRSPLLGFPDTFIAPFCREHPDDLGKALLKLPEAKWLSDLVTQKENLNAAQILEAAITYTHYDCLLDRLDPSGGKLANVEQLIELTRQLQADEEMSVEDLLEYYEELKKRRAPMASATVVDAKAGACQLMTVHAAKGLQFPVVILPDLMRSPHSSHHHFLFMRDVGLGFSLRENENDPFSNFVPTAEMEQLKEKEKLEDHAEKKRLLYVAMTRAEEKLVILWHPEVRHAGPWYGWLKESIESFGALPKWESHSEKQKKKEKPDAEAFNLFHPIKDVWSPQVRVYTVTELEKAALEMMTKKSPTKQWSPTPSLEAGLKGAELGDLVHAVLKRLTETKNGPLESIVRQKIFDLQMMASKEDEARVLKLIRDFLASDIAPPTWEGLHELPFWLKFEAAHIRGIIDYAFETDQGWVICDFKTDARFEPEKYQLQMDLYALALSKTRFKNVLETRLLFLKKGVAHVERCTKERLQKTEEKLHNLLNSSKNGTKDNGPWSNYD